MIKFVAVLLILIGFPTSILAQSNRDRGIDLFRLGDYAEAIRLFEQLRTTGEADYTTAVYLGAAYVKSGQQRHAIEILGKAKTFPRPKTPLGYDRKIKITRKPKVPLSEALLGSDGSERVQVAVELKEDGNIGFVFPFSTTSEKLVDWAVRAASGIRFKPAIVRGKPVSVVMIFEYSIER